MYQPFGRRAGYAQRFYRFPPQNFKEISSWPTKTSAHRDRALNPNEAVVGGAKRSAMGTTLHGAHLRTLDTIFRHPTAHNLEWRDVLSLMERIATVRRDGDNKWGFTIGAEHYQLHKPHTKDLTSSEVGDLRHFLQRAGCSPEQPSEAAADPDPAAPSLMIVVDHHGAKIYRIDKGPDEDPALRITPYDPHHFLHHLVHKDQSRQEGQRAPEDTEFYKRIADAVSAGGRIVVVGHGTGKSNAAQHLVEYLRTQHRETYQRIVREITADLSAITAPQLRELAGQALS
jgi:hypothetical protein